jgi:hypothetical protein
MAYIGRDTDKISNVEVLDNITFDGSSSYTLQKNSVNFTPSSANTLLVSIDGVVQAGNFTVSGSTIDFGTAVAGTSTCNFILHYGTGLITVPADGSVTTAKLGDGAVTTAKITDANVTSAKLGSDAVTTAKIADANVTSAKLGSDVTQGITEADQWRLTANLTTNADITSNLERVDTPTTPLIGTGMTESSGIFTFPSTGIYLIEVFGAIDDNGGGDSLGVLSTYVTINNSTYVLYAEGRMSIVGGAKTRYDNACFSLLLDVTNTSNVKVKFNMRNLDPTAALLGSTSKNETAFTFLRLGDT